MGARTRAAGGTPTPRALTATPPPPPPPPSLSPRPTPSPSRLRPITPPPPPPPPRPELATIEEAQVRVPKGPGIWLDHRRPTPPRPPTDTHTSISSNSSSSSGAVPTAEHESADERGPPKLTERTVTRGTVPPPSRCLASDGARPAPRRKGRGSREEDPLEKGVTLTRTGGGTPLLGEGAAGTEEQEEEAEGDVEGVVGEREQ